MKSINYFAPIKVEKSIVINADIEKIWRVLTNIDNWSTWNSDISISKIKGELQIAGSFHLKSGITLKSKIHTTNPYSEFGWTSRNLGVYVISNWRLVEIDDQTKVYVQKSMDGVFSVILCAYFERILRMRISNWLISMKRE